MIQYEQLRLRAWDLVIPERQRFIHELDRLHSVWADSRCTPHDLTYMVASLLFTFYRGR